MKRTVLKKDIEAAKQSLYTPKWYKDRTHLERKIMAAEQQGVAAYVARRGKPPGNMDAFIDSCIHHGITNALKAVH